MKLLALDTSSSACTLAIQMDDQIHTRHIVAPMQQARLILPLMQELLDELSIKLTDLDAIAYGSGPGSFTGMRIATSVVQGLTLATQKPIIRVSSLAIAAQAAYLEHGWKSICIVLDARMDQIYWAFYELNVNGLMTLIGDEHLTKPNEIRKPESKEWYGIGDGWDKYPDILNDHLKPAAIDAKQLPEAKALLLLAKSKFDQGDFLDPAQVSSDYLR